MEKRSYETLSKNLLGWIHTLEVIVFLVCIVILVQRYLNEEKLGSNGVVHQEREMSPKEKALEHKDHPEEVIEIEEAMSSESGGTQEKPEIMVSSQVAIEDMTHFSATEVEEKSESEALKTQDSEEVTKDETALDTEDVVTTEQYVLPTIEMKNNQTVEVTNKAQVTPTKTKVVTPTPAPSKTVTATPTPIPTKTPTVKPTEIPIIDEAILREPKTESALIRRRDVEEQIIEKVNSYRSELGIPIWENPYDFGSNASDNSVGEWMEQRNVAVAKRNAQFFSAEHEAGQMGAAVQMEGDTSAEEVAEKIFCLWKDSPMHHAQMIDDWRDISGDGSVMDYEVVNIALVVVYQYSEGWFYDNFSAVWMDTTAKEVERK